MSTAPIEKANIGGHEVEYKAYITIAEQTAIAVESMTSDDSKVNRALAAARAVITHIIVSVDGSRDNVATRVVDEMPVEEAAQIRELAESIFAGKKKAQ